MKNQKLNTVKQAQIETRMILKLKELDEEIRDIIFSESGSDMRDSVRMAAKYFNEKDLAKTRKYLINFYHVIDDVAKLLESKSSLVELRNKLARSKFSIYKRAGFFSAIKDFFKGKKQEPEQVAQKPKLTFETEQEQNISHLREGVRDLIIEADKCSKQVEAILAECSGYLMSGNAAQYVKNIYNIVPIAVKFGTMLQRANEEYFKPFYQLKTLPFDQYATLMQKQKQLQEPASIKGHYPPSTWSPSKPETSLKFPYQKSTSLPTKGQESCACGSGMAFMACHGIDKDALIEYMVNKMKIERPKAEAYADMEGSKEREKALTALINAFNNRERSEARRKEKQRRALLTEEQREDEDLIEEVDLNWVKDL